MGLFDRLFRRQRRPLAAPDTSVDGKIRYVEEKLAGCQVPSDPTELAALSANRIDQIVAPIFDVIAASQGRCPMVFGLAVSLDAEIDALAKLHARDLLNQWHSALREIHGDAASHFLAEVGEHHGIAIPGGVPRRGRRRHTFDADPDIPKEPVFDAPDDPELRGLEAAVLADPDNDDARLVYGDALQAAGHPRGELIALAHRGLETEASKHLDRHRDTLLTESLARAVRDGIIHLEWRLGFIEAANVGTTVDAITLGDDPSGLLAELLRHPSASILRGLTLGVASDDGDFSFAVEEIVESGARPTLQCLHLADFDYPDDIEMSWAFLGDLAGLWPLMPDLRDVIIQGAEMEIGPIALPRAERFAIRTGGLPGDAWAAIADAEWPALRELELWFGDAGYGAEVEVDELGRLDPSRLPALKSLRLMNAEFTDDIPAELAESPLLAQLETLDLSMGRMSADGARALIAHRDRFAHLREIAVGQNFISAGAMTELCRALPQVVPGEQEEDVGPEDRFVSVGE